MSIRLLILHWMLVEEAGAYAARQAIDLSGNLVRLGPDPELASAGSRGDWERYAMQEEACPCLWV